MLDVFIWLIAIELIGLLAFPLAFALLPWLPDRGYSLTKPLGLLLVFYPLWLLGSTQVIPNGVLTIALIMVVLAAVSLLIFWLRQNEMAAFLGREWKFLERALPGQAGRHGKGGDRFRYSAGVGPSGPVHRHWRGGGGYLTVRSGPIRRGAVRDLHGGCSSGMTARKSSFHGYSTTSRNAGTPTL